MAAQAAHAPLVFGTTLGASARTGKGEISRLRVSESVVQPVLNVVHGNKYRAVSMEQQLCHGVSFLQGKNRSVLSSTVLESSASPVAITAPESTKVSPLQLTYLEGNSWMFEMAGVCILLDPIMGHALDFNIPWLYSANKNVTRDMTVDDLPPFEYLFITQGFDDHCHLKTLEPLAKNRPDLPVIASPNAESMLSGLFTNVTYLEPGQSTTIRGSNGAEISIKATAGPVLGPPWQRPENGYIFRSENPKSSLYLEPHCVYRSEVEKEAPVQVVVTPVVKQELPAFTLVSGQEDAVELARLLQADFVVPMANAELDARGLLAKIVKPEGTVESFEAMLKEKLPRCRLLLPTANEPLSIPPSE